MKDKLKALKTAIESVVYEEGFFVGEVLKINPAEDGTKKIMLIESEQLFLRTNDGQYRLIKTNVDYEGKTPLVGNEVLSDEISLTDYFVFNLRPATILETAKIPTVSNKRVVAEPIPRVRL